MTTVNSLVETIEAESRRQTAELSGPMLEVCRYAMQGGRCTRAMLLFNAAQQSCPRAILAATAIEMIHAATLLQDDIFDAGELRRGRMAAHLRFGKPLAILASDWLLIRALELASDVDLQFFRCLAQAGTAMAQAEAREFSAVPLQTLNEAQSYGAIIACGKTAALFGTALCGAAVLQGLSAERLRRWEKLGMQMGLTYQMVDDCLDLYGGEAAAGKTVGHDLPAGCFTLPVLLAALSLENERAPLSLEDLQTGKLPLPELLRLKTAIQSLQVRTHVQKLLQTRFEAHRQDAADAELPLLAVDTWKADLLTRLAPCLVDTTPRAQPVFPKSTPHLSEGGQLHA